MKQVLYVISAILILAGGVFFLQGIRILPSALMYGKTEWVVIGAGLVIVGAVLALVVNRRGARTK